MSYEPRKIKQCPDCYGVGIRTSITPGSGPYDLSGIRHKKCKRCKGSGLIDVDFDLKKKRYD